MSLEVIRSKRFKDGGVYRDQLNELIQEYMKMPKNISIYSDFGRNRQIRHFLFDQRLLLITLIQIVTIKSYSLDCRWSARMKPRDRMRLNRHVTPTVRSSLDVCDVSTSLQKSIECVKSLIKRLRLNALKCESSSNHKAPRTPFT